MSLLAEGLGWAVVTVGLFDVWRPLGFLVMGWVLISIGDRQQKLRASQSRGRERRGDPAGGAS